MSTKYSNFAVKINEDFGDEYLSFYIEAEQESGTGIFTTTFSVYRDFLEECYSALAQYIHSIRKTIGGYGTKEKQIYDILVSEDFDFEHYFILLLESDPTRIPDEIMRQKLFNQNKEAVAQLHAQMQQLNSLIPQNSIKATHFLDQLEQAILRHLIEHYPELTNAEPDDIKQLQNILTKDVLSLGNKLINHIQSIRDR